MPTQDLTTVGAAATRRRTRRRTRATTTSPIGGVRTGAGTGIGSTVATANRDVTNLASYIRGCANMYGAEHNLTEQQVFSSLKKHLPW